MQNRLTLTITWCLIVCVPHVARCQEMQAAPVVVATVNEEPIYRAELHRYLEKLPTTTDENIEAGEPRALRAIIQRQLALEYLRQRDFVSDAQVDAEIQRRRAQLAKRNELLETVCEEQGITEAALRRSIAWNIAWANYLGKHLDYQSLKRYFEKHRAHFDGGDRDVAHILWELNAELTPEQLQELRTTAIDVRGQIERNEVSFADAAREHSQGPSAADGGALGSIQRGGPMTNAFSKAAFDLESGEVSRPVTDPFGVHLIQCVHAEPGKLKFKDVRSEVERAARADLFSAIAKRAGKNAEIKLINPAGADVGE